MTTSTKQKILFHCSSQVRFVRSSLVLTAILDCRFSAVLSGQSWPQVVLLPEFNARLFTDYWSFFIVWGYLFRGILNSSILFPFQAPNYLGKMLTIKVFSQNLVLSFKTIRPDIPWGALCVGHCGIMWSVLCSVTPHSQFKKIASHNCPYIKKSVRNARTSKAFKFKIKVGFELSLLGNPIPENLVLTLDMNAKINDALF